MKSYSHQHDRHARRVESSQQDEVESSSEFEQSDSAPAQVIVSVVYVTAEPTFDGTVVGYTTLGQDDGATPPEVEQTTPPTERTTPPSIKSHTPTVTSTLKTSTSSSTIPASSVENSTPLVPATGAPPRPATAIPTAPADTSSSGMSAGGKAGVAIGILLLLGAALVLLLFFFKKKRRAAKRERLDDEKSDVVASSARSVEAGRVEPTSPHRLSLRPLTQFQPFKEKQEMNQAPISTGNSELNEKNPFGNHAEAIDTTNPNGPLIIEGVSTCGEVSSASATAAAISPTPSSPAPTVLPGAPAPAPYQPVGLARSASKPGDSLKQIDLTTKSNTVLNPPSPSGSEVSIASTAQSAAGMAIVAAGGPPNTTVHRVQLDFVPSMDDELLLKAGELIRILREYDDGWALCIRLDRSKQGVVPRTCLSTRPVKARQQTGPQGSPAMRPQQRHMPSGTKPGVPRPQNKNGPPYSSSSVSNRTITPTGPSPNGSPPNGSSPNGSSPNGPLTSGPSPSGPSPSGLPRPMPPNAQGPPRGPPKPSTPQGPLAPRPLSPQDQRPMVPPNHPNQQLPMTPQAPLAPNLLAPQGQENQQQPVTPQGQANQQQPVTPQNQQVTPPSEGRARSDSDTDPITRQLSPPMNPPSPTDGPSSSQSPPNARNPIERKPVPGQAI